MKNSSPDHLVDERAESYTGSEILPESERSMLVDPVQSRSSFGRLPAATVFVGLAAGILCDRNGSFLPTVLLWGFVVACLVWFALQSIRRIRESTVLVLVISGFAGAIYHHHVWGSIPEVDIAPLLSRTPVLIRCEGVVASATVVTPPRENPFSSSLPPKSATQFQLDVESLDTNAGPRTVSGRLQIVIDGILDGVHRGDRVEVQGWSQANRPLMNPGGFDVEAYQRSKGVRGIVRVKEPELVKVVVASQSIVEWVRRTIRERAEAVLEKTLPDDVRPIADAMLLGDRSTLQDETRTIFVESGTVHLLAISGLHIGILMMFLLAVGRAMRLSSRHSIVLAVAVLFVYLQVADCRPPMVRAFVIIVIWSVARLVRRPAFSANSLAVAAIVILGMNPTSLFDVGSQLSFLAVTVIFWLASLGRLPNDEPDVAATSADVQPRNGASARSDSLQRPWVRSLKAIGRQVGTMWLVSGSIWVVSSPLVMSVFNVVSPAGLVINVLLIPIVGVGLCSGFAAILIGIVSPSLAGPFAFVFGWFLKGLVATVEFAASVDVGHAYVPEPPNWWLIVFYLITACAMLATTLKHHSARAWCGVAVWTIFGLTLLPADRAEGSLRCTVLSVGHGLSVIVETPRGKTLVYDAGSRSGGDFSARVLQEALWARGLSQVDALIVSHSDVDHYNGVPGLLDSVPIGSIFCSRHCPDACQPLTLQMFERAEELGTASKFVSQGDQLGLDDAVRMQILQPVAATSYGSDNASSVILEIEYRDRRILLTGDLDEDGLVELLKQPSRMVDVLLAPHHGEPDANPPALADWATPSWVIASAPTPAYYSELTSHYAADTEVIMTSEAGAVSVEITSGGELRVESFLGGSR
ncbi:MAG: DNA internalization-related competence protein ComEC/Rec2 [Rhodopirellula sp.]|nr:DNA internalization-related competence protein ComEC/Rec2 [Rhodopirellula sp.]